MLYQCKNCGHIFERSMFLKRDVICDGCKAKKLKEDKLAIYKNYYKRKRADELPAPLVEENDFLECYQEAILEIMNYDFSMEGTHLEYSHTLAIYHHGEAIRLDLKYEAMELFNKKTMVKK